MFDVKIFIILSFIVLGSYATLWVLGSFEWFKEYKDAGVTFVFDAVLGLVAFLTGIIGIYMNGVKEGIELEKKTESD